MSTTQQPEALRLAGLLELAPETGIEPQTAEDAAAELRRLHTENEALRAERERNLNSIRVCNEIINKKNAELESLRTGYAAARLEIESLKAQMAAHADELTVAHLDGLMRTRSVAPDPRPVVEMCAKALAEELAAWDIDPPLHHVKEAHDACELWLAAIDTDRAAQEGKK